MYLSMNMFLSLSPKHSETYPLSFLQSPKEITKINTTDHAVDGFLNGWVGDVVNQLLSYRGDGYGY